MRRWHVLLLLLVALVAGSVPVEAQQRRPDRWQAVLDNGDIIWDFRLVKLDGDQLQVRQSDTTATIAVGTIKELRLIQPSEMRIGTGNVASAPSIRAGSVSAARSSSGMFIVATCCLNRSLICGAGAYSESRSTIWAALTSALSAPNGIEPCPGVPLTRSLRHAIPFSPMLTVT